MTDDARQDSQQEGPHNEAQKPDWRRLASEALDLWQTHVTALASDPQAKAQMTQFVAPMTEMFSQWTGLVQQGFETMASQTEGWAAQHAAAAAQAQNQPQAQNATTQDGSSAQDCAPVCETETGVAPESLAQASVRPACAPVAETPVFSVQTLCESPHDEPAVSQSVPSESYADVSASAPAPADEPPTRGRAPSADGVRDLAELTGRLAQLERELDELRARGRRPGGQAGDSAGAAANG